MDEKAKMDVRLEVVLVDCASSALSSSR